MKVEDGLDRIRKSPVTWLMGAAISLTAVGSWNAMGMFSTIREIRESASSFQQQQINQWSEQQKTNQRLDQNWQLQQVFNAEQKAQTAAIERRLQIIEEREFKR